MGPHRQERLAQRSNWQSLGEWLDGAPTRKKERGKAYQHRQVADEVKVLLEEGNDDLSVVPIGFCPSHFLEL